MAATNQLYSEIAETIRKEIHAGVYGNQLPNGKELQDRFGVSATTIRTALALIAEDNLIVRIPGKGTFVNNKDLNTNNIYRESDNRKGELSKKIVGIILPRLRGGVFTHLLFGALDELEKYKCNSLVGLTHSNFQRESELIREFCELGATGLVVWPSEGEQFSDTLLRLHLSGFPVVFVDRWLPGIDMKCVRADHKGGAQQAVRHLFELGHRHLAFLSLGSEDPENTQSVQERLRGFMTESLSNISSNGTTRIWMRPIQPEETMQDHVDWLATQFLDNQDVTAVVGVEPYDLECVRRFAQRSGQSIPKALSVVGFDAGNIDPDRDKGWISFLSDMKWTWIDQSEEEIGREAVRILLNDKIETMEKSQNVIPAVLRVGDTTALI